MIAAWVGRVLGWGQENGDATGARSAPPSAETATNWLFASNELAAELARTRRYEHDLSIVVLSASPLEHPSTGGGGGGTSSQLSRLPHVVFLLTSGALRGMLRQSDIVYYQPADEQFVIALAEADAEQARHALRRVGCLFLSRFSLNVSAGVAAFPHDGLTLPDLVAKAVERTRLVALGDAGNAAPAAVPLNSNGKASKVG